MPIGTETMTEKPPGKVKKKSVEMTHPVVMTIGGLPGSGTTTAADHLAKKLDLPWTNGGKIFREMAKEKGMELNEFGVYAENEPAVDQELDRRLLENLKKGNIILESRLAGAHANLNGIHSLRVWLHAPLLVRVKRIIDREGGDVGEMTEAVLERERSERTRYIEYYDIDYEYLDHYSLVINSSEYWPEQIVSIILEALRTKGMI